MTVLIPKCAKAMQVKFNVCMCYPLFRKVIALPCRLKPLLRKRVLYRADFDLYLGK